MMKIAITEQFIEIVNKQLEGKGHQQRLSQETLVWFIAKYEAGRLQDMSAHELTEMLINGMPAIDNAYVVKYLHMMTSISSSDAETLYYIRLMIQVVYEVDMEIDQD